MPQTCTISRSKYIRKRFPDYCNSFHNIVENVQQNNNGNITAIGRPKKGRKRKFAEYTLSERKNRKYNNLPYQGRSNAVMPKIYK